MKNSKKAIDFALVGIRTEQFAILEANYNAKKETAIGTKLEVKIDDENKHIGIFSEVVFLQGKKTFLKICVSCHFEVEENSWAQFIVKKQKKIIIPSYFLAHLAMITIGTTRGVLFAKTEGSPFAKFIIPTINVTELFTDDIQIDID
ncbi:MAG: hypothetical protein ACRCYO_01220 [Bacteroidia bacterium]